MLPRTLFPTHGLAHSQALCFVINWRRLGFLCLFALPSIGLAAPLDPPTSDALREARELVRNMMSNDKGPYANIRWFCKDGTVQPPTAYACKNRGGGKQHATYSAQRNRLQQLGYPVGTIVTALTWNELFDPSTRFRRLGDLALENYLVSIDDGWVLRRAKNYRGRVQIEDETASGRALLQRLMADQQWLTKHYLLAREMVRVVPHGQDSDSARRARRAIQELAEANPSATPLRLEVHSAPTAQTASKVRRWADSAPNERARTDALGVAEALDELFGVSFRQSRITTLLRELQQQLPADRYRLLVITDPSSLTGLGRTMRQLRKLLESEATATAKLLTFDLLGEYELQLLALAAEHRHPQNRKAAVQQAVAYVDASYAVGLLSETERASILTDTAAAKNRWSFEAYRRFVHQLQRAPQWAVGALRYHFAESLTTFTALDPRAARFVDDLLRGSPLLPLAQTSQILAAELQQLSGVGINLFGKSPTGVVALNPGYATGALRLVKDDADLSTVKRSDIVVISETSAELPPVAGILTLGEGNLLSHVQLLARNFGIPNVAIAPEVMSLIRSFDGQEVTLVAGPDGAVVLLAKSLAAETAGDLLSAPDPAKAGKRLRVPAPNLSVTNLLPLADLHRGLSGQVVGPKAANLGELNRLFPGKVAPAIAIPFGLFAEHTAVGANNLRSQLEQAYATYRRGESSLDELNATLQNIRSGIASLTFKRSAELDALMNKLFGANPKVGVFVRSDTNVEDLPEFTGAGLSETQANVVGRETLLRAIANVWSSVLSPRAIAWRSNLLENPADVYASVLLMQSVDSSKSGVMVTSNLIEPTAPGLTVSTAWGVGGAVSGEAAATIVLNADGSTRFVSEAKAPYRRQLDPQGGLNWIPADDGLVLTQAEQTQLRQLAMEVDKKYQPVLDSQGQARPWDIEFGFVDGQLALFQIRPLVEKGQARTQSIMRRFYPTTPTAPANINLNVPVRAGKS